jgi:hypothetical protein
MSFKEEMDKRLRRLCRVTNDSLEVVLVEKLGIKTEWAGYSCEWSEGTFEAVIRVLNGREVVGTETFKDLGELMRALDEVEL